jgi:hypothetical protein
VTDQQPSARLALQHLGKDVRPSLDRPRQRRHDED